MEEITEKLQKLAVKSEGRERIKFVPEMKYEIEKITLTKKSLEELVIVNPRKLHTAQVQSIYEALLQGMHFDSIFVINRRADTLRVIDGNHRVEALRLFFTKYSRMKVTIFSAMYDNMDDVQERAIFTRWNISITQSTDDFINSYKDTIPMFSRFVNEMECSVYGRHNRMKLRDVATAYYASFEKPYHGGEGKTKIDFIQYMQRLTDSDLDIIIQNFRVLKTIFDAENRKDWMRQAAFQNVSYRALYYLVANNLDRLGEVYIKRKMAASLVGRTIMDDYRHYSGRRASVDAYLAFKTILNDTKSNKKFI